MLSFVTFCRVSYRDIDDVEHGVSVEAETLYEAVAVAVRRFREHCWVGHRPGPGCEFKVEVHRQPPQVYRIELKKIEQFAKHGTAKGPSEVLRKERLKKLLEMGE
jgi:hypothetical protein